MKRSKLTFATLAFSLLLLNSAYSIVEPAHSSQKLSLFGRFKSFLMGSKSAQVMPFQPNVVLPEASPILSTRKDSGLNLDSPRNPAPSTENLTEVISKIKSAYVLKNGFKKLGEKLVVPNILLLESSMRAYQHENKRLKLDHNEFEKRVMREQLAAYCGGDHLIHSYETAPSTESNFLKLQKNQTSGRYQKLGEVEEQLYSPGVVVRNFPHAKHRKLIKSTLSFYMPSFVHGISQIGLNLARLASSQFATTLFNMFPIVQLAVQGFTAAKDLIKTGKEVRYEKRDKEYSYLNYSSQRIETINPAYSFKEKAAGDKAPVSHLTLTKLYCKGPGHVDLQDSTPAVSTSTGLRPKDRSVSEPSLPRLLKTARSNSAS